MVSNTRGLRDWIMQRFTSIIIALYFIQVIGYIICYQPLDYTEWHALFSHVAEKVAAMIVLLSILVHAWIGLWTVFTDYVKSRSLRIVLQTVVILLLLTFVVWGIEILWG